MVQDALEQLHWSPNLPCGLCLATCQLSAGALAVTGGANASSAAGAQPGGLRRLQQGAGLASGDPAFADAELALREVQNSLMELAVLLPDRCGPGLAWPPPRPSLCCSVNAWVKGSGRSGR